MGEGVDVDVFVEALAEGYVDVACGTDDLVADGGECRVKLGEGDAATLAPVVRVGVPGGVVAAWGAGGGAVGGGVPGAAPGPFTYLTAAANLPRAIGGGRLSRT